MNKFFIREINANDIIDINNIYNDSIKLGYSTAHNVAMPISFHQEWYEKHQKQSNPILVAVDGNKVVAWNALSYYREGRQALIGVRETSYYIDQNYWNLGIASQLMLAIIDKAKKIEVDTLLTFIMADNQSSIQLMKKFDFELWGRLPKIIRMDRKVSDHLIFGLNLDIPGKN